MIAYFNYLKTTRYLLSRTDPFVTSFDEARRLQCTWCLRASNISLTLDIACEYWKDKLLFCVKICFRCYLCSKEQMKINWKVCYGPQEYSKMKTTIFCSWQYSIGFTYSWDLKGDLWLHSGIPLGFVDSIDCLNVHEYHASNWNIVHSTVKWNITFTDINE